MSTMLSRFIKPVSMASRFSSNQSTFYNSMTRVALTGQQQHHPQRNLETTTSKLMATSAANYHYHEKPPSHAHDRLWKAERYLSLSLLGFLPAAAAIPHPILDYAVALSLVVHVHWGVEAIVTDYIRPSIFGATIPKLSIALVYILSSLALGGLFMFNYTDVGITQAVRMLAKV